MKTVLSNLLILLPFLAQTQTEIFTENFEQQKLDSSWQVITGNWHIGDVSELSIAPAEGGYRHVLCSGGEGEDGANLIRLFIDIPKILQGKRLRLSFAYYVLADASGPKVDGEFYQKEMVDGLRGRPWSATLRRLPGRWGYFQKILTVPARTNTVRFVFYGLKPSGNKKAAVCFDTVLLAVTK